MFIIVSIIKIYLLKCIIKSAVINQKHFFDKEYIFDKLHCLE
jgi:hypothetical protein